MSPGRNPILKRSTVGATRPCEGFVEPWELWAVAGGGVCASTGFSIGPALFQSAVSLIGWAPLRSHLKRINASSVEKMVGQNGGANPRVQLEADFPGVARIARGDHDQPSSTIPADYPCSPRPILRGPQSLARPHADVQVLPGVSRLTTGC